MNSDKFKSGDRIVVNDSADAHIFVMCLIRTGYEGTVVFADDEHIGVEFDKDFGGHSCNGAGEDGRCLWFYYGDDDYPTSILTTLDDFSPEKQKVMDSFVEEFF